MRLISINSTQYKGQHMLKSISIMSLALLFSSTLLAQTQDNKLSKEEREKLVKQLEQELKLINTLLF